MSRGVRGRCGRRGIGTLGPFLVALMVGALALAGCQSGNGTSASGSGGTGASGQGAGSGQPNSALAAAKVDIAPSNGSARVRLDKPITVRVAQGKLDAVTVTTASGAALTGSLAPDQLSWTSTGKLAAGTSYTVAVQVAAPNGKTTSSTSSFSTLTPKGTVSAFIQPGDGWTAGVGMPVVVNFSEPVAGKDRSGVEKALKVNTATNLQGSWRWFGPQQVQWRPEVYWPTGTRVNVTADLRGVEISPGIWGSGRHTSDFSIGSAMISTVDVSHHTLTVRRNGTVLRVIPVTTGKAGMATRNGIKVIMSRETSHEMNSTSIGIPKDSPGYYDIVAKYAMRLTNSGEFLHAAPWSAGAQGHANVSHGCTGMSMANAKWLFDHSKVGDVVIFKNSTRSLEWGNGYTAWNMSYSQWQNA